MMQLGVIGLGTMGANLARNAARNGAQVVLFNRTKDKTRAFMKQFGTEGDFVPAETLRQFLSALGTPRVILLMVKAGEAVDAVIEESLPSLRKGDILIDAGNSHYRDTERREAHLLRQGVHFIGMGVSGGEEGALRGPSMMPGGDPAAVKKLLPLLRKMSATDGAGGACVTHVGPGGAGHFVKMIHNGIEYAVMQLIAESYDLLKSLSGLTNKDLAKTFAAWSRSDDLGSYLTEITARIFTVKDPGTHKDLIDLIDDAAGQKGTGRWTMEAAMELGMAIPSINAAVDARLFSGEKEYRTKAGKTMPTSLLPLGRIAPGIVRSALELSVICAYAEGFELMAKMAAEKKWNLDLAEIARIWRGGCIIRSRFLVTLQKALAGSSAAKKAILMRLDGARQRQWRQAVAAGIARGVPMPALSASLWFYDSLRRDRLPQNLIQAQRDFFGAHTYRRTDRAGDFHTVWNR